MYRAVGVLRRRGPGGSALLHLGDADVVAGIAEAEVDAVRLVDRLLGDLHAPGPELRVGLVRVVAGEEQVPAGGPLADELPHLRGGLLAEGRRARLLQQDCAVGLARQVDGQPPHGAEVHVGLHLEPELADVEVERLVLVGDVDLGDGDGGQHGRDAREGHTPGASPELLGLAQAIAKHVGTGGSGPRRRYTDGGSPATSRNTRLNVPRLLKPTAMHTSVTLRSVVRSRNIARSTRRRCRYRCGVSPKVARNVRMKWASDTCAIRARVGTSRGSA